MYKYNKKGFTLIELLAVIVILAIILIIAVPTILGVIDKARKDSLASSVKMYASALETNYLISQTSDTPLVAPITGQVCPPVANFNGGTCTYDLVVTNNVPVATVTIVGSGKFSGYIGIGTKTGTVQIINSSDYDTTAPVITLLGDNPMNLDQGIIYTEPGATASDDNDGDVTDDIVITGTVDTNTAGSYTVTYTVKDSNGNESTSTRTVNIIAINYSGPGYIESKGVNGPVLATGMVPIKWNGTSWVDTVPTDSSWYNYDTTNKQWANARTADGSFWVWVPRYAYKIPSWYHMSTQGTISIKFLKGTTLTATDNSTVATVPTYSGSSQTNYIQEPTFTFGTTELTGIWVAKFEMSGTTASLDSKPGATSLKNTAVGAMFTATRNMETNSKYGWALASGLNADGTFTTDNNGVDTHLMKNTEWGAVLYLAKSIYGNNSELFRNNSYSYKTGCSGGSSTAASYVGCQYTYDKTPEGVGASTTGTIYGIFDMHGGANEYIMANYNYTAGSSGLTPSSINSKYIDIYTSYDATKYGDAVYETSSSSSGSSSWYSDYSNFITSGSPWTYRGGNYDNTTGVGAFSFLFSSGAGSISIGFRSTLLVNAGL